MSSYRYVRHECELSALPSYVQQAVWAALRLHAWLNVKLRMYISWDMQIFGACVGCCDLVLLTVLGILLHVIYGFTVLHLFTKLF